MAQAAEMPGPRPSQPMMDNEPRVVSECREYYYSSPWGRTRRWFKQVWFVEVYVANPNKWMKIRTTRATWWPQRGRIHCVSRFTFEGACKYISDNCWHRGYASPAQYRVRRRFSRKFVLPAALGIDKTEELV
jgi:hypothetical protein